MALPIAAPFATTSALAAPVAHRAARHCQPTVSTRAAFAPSAAGVASRTPALAQCRLPAHTKARPASGVAVTMAEGRGAADDLSRDLGKMASALALSALLVLPSAAPAKEQLGGNFKVLQGAASTQVAPGSVCRVCGSSTNVSARATGPAPRERRGGRMAYRRIMG